MILRRLCIYALAVLLGLGPAVGARAGVPSLSSVAVVVYDADFNHELYAKNPHQQRSIASLTKVMTILLVCEMIQAGEIDLEEVVTASANAASRGGTEIKLKSGDKFTVEELLYAAALASANDAAVALAEHVAGSEQEFARLMTNRAKELGLKDTSFVDATGLLSIYSGNYSTAYEMAILSRFAMENPLFRRFVSTREYELKPQNKTIRNSNALLHEVDGVNGVKTGATTPAGHTLITSVTREGRSLIVVVLGAPSREVRNDESEALVEYAYERLETVIPRDELIARVNVPDGVTHMVGAVLKQDLSVFVFSEADRQIETRVELVRMRAPVTKGDKVGELVVLRAGEEFGRMDLVADQSTGLASFLRRIWNWIIQFFARLF